VTTDSVSSDLRQLEDDVRRLSAGEAPAHATMADRAKLVEQEVVVGEYLAAEEAMENLGSLFGMVSELNSIQIRQLKQLAGDHRETLKRMTEARSPGELAELGFDHYRRLSEHLIEGFNESVEVITTEGRFLNNTLVEMWKPFFELVRRDWASGQSHPTT
jgi:hypothetical protein